MQIIKIPYRLKHVKICGQNTERRRKWVYSTGSKLNNFSVPQILREINFSQIRPTDIVIWSILEAMKHLFENFGFFVQSQTLHINFINF